METQKMISALSRARKPYYSKKNIEMMANQKSGDNGYYYQS